MNSFVYVITYFSHTSNSQSEITTLNKLLDYSLHLVGKTATTSVDMKHWSRTFFDIEFMQQKKINYRLSRVSTRLKQVTRMIDTKRQQQHV